MKIGLFDIDSKYHNLALMKISAWHKSFGDQTELYNPLMKENYDRVYVSKIFSKHNKEEGYIPKNSIIGGSGYSLKTVLPYDMEHFMPDYDLYNLNYSLGFTTRGCIRNCGFCIVREKEGNIREHTEVEEFLNSKSNVIVLLDNNFLALPSHIKKLNHYINKGWIMDFNQGLDIRLVNKENAKLLAKIKHYKQIRFAWDFIETEKEVKEGLNILFKAGVKPYQVMVYILCNFNTTIGEDIYRQQELNNLGVDPFIMLYGEANKRMRNLQRWANRRQINKKCKFEDYKVNND